MKDTARQDSRSFMIILPPKRFEDDSDPRFDSVRHKGWFPALRERREKLPLLREAKSYYDGNSDVSQMECAAMFSVDERELRDYCSFVNKSFGKPSSTFQHILDRAYEIYCLNKGDISLRACLDRVAGFYGKNPRHVMEDFEVNPTFLPTGYVYQPAATNGCNTSEKQTKVDGARSG